MTKYKWIGGAREFMGAYTILDENNEEIAYTWDEKNAKLITDKLNKKEDDYGRRGTIDLAY